MQHIELIKAFHETKSFLVDKVKGFTLSSKRKSDYYVDCKTILSYPQYRNLIARIVCNTYNHLLEEIDVIGGLEIGAIPIASAISDYYFQNTKPSRVIRTFVVRKEAKAHGLGHSVEGSFNPGERALVVDDVLTTGQSTTKAIEEARKAGLIVKYALVIVDREEDDGKKTLEEKTGVRLLRLLTRDDLMAFREVKRTPSSAPITV